MVRVDTGVDNRNIGTVPGSTIRMCFLRIDAIHAPRNFGITGIDADRVHRSIPLDIPYVASPSEGVACLLGELAGDGLPDRPEIKDALHRRGP
jgi:hypothetical protein